MKRIDEKDDSIVYSIRLTGAQKRKLERAARTLGYAPSAYVRLLVDLETARVNAGYGSIVHANREPA